MSLHHLQALEIDLLPVILCPALQSFSVSMYNQYSAKTQKDPYANFCKQSPQIASSFPEHVEKNANHLSLPKLKSLISQLNKGDNLCLCAFSIEIASNQKSGVIIEIIQLILNSQEPETIFTHRQCLKNFSPYFAQFSSCSQQEFSPSLVIPS